MANWGSVDFEDLRKLKDNIDKLIVNKDLWMTELAKEVAARVLGGAIRNTKRMTKRRSGTLERSWFVGNITKKGDVYEITVINNATSSPGTPYAGYVEFGHRTRDHKGWVQGRFMLTVAVKDVEKRLPSIVEQIIYRKLLEVFKV